MKKKQFYLFSFMLFSLSVPIHAQVGLSSQSIPLEDNNFIGIVWEPEARVYYYEKGEKEYYGLLMVIKTSGDYLGVNEGNKVSIEYTDGSREVVEVVNSFTDFKTHVSNNTVTSVYMREIQVLPDFAQLTTKQIKRFVIQRNNGNLWTIDTTSRRAKKILKELPPAMQSAVASYRKKVANNNYFE